MKWLIKQLIKGKEVLLGLLGFGISLTAQDVASTVILFGSAFLIAMGILKVTLGIKLPLIKYLEPLVRPLRIVRIAENPTKTGEELGTLILDVDKKIGGKKMREKVFEFMKNKIVVNKFSNGSFLVIMIALILFIANQQVELVENVNIEVYLAVSAAISAVILRKLKVETNDEFDRRYKTKDYQRKQKSDEKAAKIIMKENKKVEEKQALNKALAIYREQNKQ